MFFADGNIFFCAEIHFFLPLQERGNQFELQSPLRGVGHLVVGHVIDFGEIVGVI